MMKNKREIRNLSNSKRFTWQNFLILVGKLVFSAGVIVLVAKLFGSSQVVLRTSQFDRNTFDAEYGTAFLFFIFAFPFYAIGVLFSWPKTSSLAKKFWPVALLLVFGGTYGLSIAAEQLDNYLLRDTVVEFAAGRDELDKVKAYMQDNPHDTTATRLLSHAVAGNALETSKYLIEKGGDPDVHVTWYGDTVHLIYKTLNTGNPELLSLVIQHGADVHATRYSSKKSLLHHIVSNPIQNDTNRLILIDTLINKGIPVNVTDEFGRTPLHVAVDRMKYDVTEHLISRGAEVNALDSREYSVLFEAITSHNAEKGQEDEQKLKMVKLLLKNGANMEGQLGRDYVYWAKKAKHEKLTAYLDSTINSIHNNESF